MASKARLTPQEYLAQERLAETKSEYFRGAVTPVERSGRWHFLIVVNSLALLSKALHERPCEVYASDMRVKVSPTGLYTYPDVVVVCGEPLFEDAVEDTLLNPRAIFEVLSESTEAYDRGKKFHHYSTIDSLQDYVLISQNEHRIERLSRQPDGLWSLANSTGLDGQIEIPSLQIVLRLTDIYSKVNVDVPDTE